MKVKIVLCSWGEVCEGGSVEALTLVRRLAEAKGAGLHWLVKKFQDG